MLRIGALAPEAVPGGVCERRRHSVPVEGVDAAPGRGDHRGGLGLPMSRRYPSVAKKKHVLTRTMAAPEATLK